ncbi:LOG family protein [candidate division WWE3 bacterium]|uniref:LOG family protein n=1 Tax=candidate division WWE3 bacterium TaxID=2053526 RepID=A0A955RPX5_UNCKA|nr:LOG family protein [candidate division WWE3 bacterium]
MNVKKVAFLGFAESKPTDPEYKAAFETAKLVAENGYTVVNGGGPGVMRAATEGAHAGGGKAIGVTFYPKDLPHFEGRDKDNLFDEEVVTENYIERTLTMLNDVDIHIFFNGGSGTVSEFGMAWGLARIHYGAHKELILFGEFWHDILETFAENMRIRDEEVNLNYTMSGQHLYHIVDSSEDVLKILTDIKEGKNGHPKLT